MSTAALEHMDLTLDEPWELEWPDSQHPYMASALFALRGLGLGHGRTCLIVGSTVFEARMLRGHLWIGTMLDVRRPPVDDLYYRRGDATDLPFSNADFDALSSTCCLCHAGLGRYGDAVVERGDHVAMREFARVLKKGGKASVMFGPCHAIAEGTVVVGNVHRVYALSDAGNMATGAGFRIDTVGLWCSVERRWLAAEEPVKRGSLCYLSMLLEKL